MEKVRKMTKNIIVKMAKKSAAREVNSACPFVNYQPKESQIVKKLRKF